MTASGSASGSAPTGRRQVVMLVADDVRSDTRVRSSALAVAGLGVRVTVIGVTTGPRRWDTVLGDPPPGVGTDPDPDPDPDPGTGTGSVRIIRMPVDYALRNHRQDRRARLRRGDLPLLVPDADRETLTRLRLAAAQIQADVAAGPVGALRRRAVQARWFALRAGGAGRRRAVRLAAAGFTVWDRSWQQVSLAASPHRVLPELDDFELALGATLDELAPDLIHVHDVHLIGIAARAVARAGAAGHDVRWLYDAHEWVPGLPHQGSRTARMVAAWAELERRHVRDADRVITASAAIAASLQARYRLARLPDVVLDVPPPQAEVLRGVYRDLLGSIAARDEPVAAVEPPERLVLGRPPVDRATVFESARVESARVESARVEPVFLAIGPANSAGQAWAWARAAERYLPSVRGRVVAIRNGRYDYPADELVDADRYRSDPRWQLRQLADARSRWTHVLLEAGRPILGGLAGRDFVGDARLLTQAGVRVGLAVHGSELRNPRRHRAADQFSPFADPREALTRRLQGTVDVLAPLVGQFAASGGEVFVSTPDQLDDLPTATWLPVVVDPQQWPVRADTLERAVPLFVHAPSNPQLKGTAEVERVLRPLADRGLIEYRLLTGLPPGQAAELIASADVVVDQLLLGLYGVLACEAMAAGTLVLGHLGDALRDRIDRDVPVLEVTPPSLAEVVQRVLDDRDWARARAAQGPAFVAALHDGRRSADVLGGFLGRIMTNSTMNVGSPRPDVEPVEGPGP